MHTTVMPSQWAGVPNVLLCQASEVSLKTGMEHRLTSKLFSHNVCVACSYVQNPVHIYPKLCSRRKSKNWGGREGWKNPTALTKGTVSYGLIPPLCSKTRLCAFFVVWRDYITMVAHFDTNFSCPLQLSTNSEILLIWSNIFIMVVSNY